MGAMHFFSDEILPFFNTEIGFFGGFYSVNLTNFFTIFLLKFHQTLDLRKEEELIRYAPPGEQLPLEQRATVNQHPPAHHPLDACY